MMQLRPRPDTALAAETVATLFTGDFETKHDMECTAKKTVQGAVKVS